MIKPVNGHILIEPITHESFMATQNDTYQEIGVVRGIPTEDLPPFSFTVKVGDKVFFDSWLAARYPKAGGRPDEFYWLVKWEDVRAIEHAE
jgi:co-chaperonin GroES (HSP10)